MSTKDTSVISPPLNDPSAINPQLNEKSAKEEDQEAFRTPDQFGLCSYKDAPSYLQDNELIIQGYLFNCNTISKVMSSLFICHNESVNIWSHLLGALGVIALVFYTVICINENNQVISIIDLNEMIEEIKEVTNPWILFLNDHDYNSNADSKDDIHYNLTINSLIKMTNELISKINNQYNIADNIFAYIIKGKTVLEDIRDSLGFNSVFSAFNILQSNLNSIANKALIIFQNEDNAKAQDSPEIIKGLSKIPLFIMLGSAFICLGFSAFFHWFKVLSKEATNLLSRFDYAGITILISGSCYPPFYYWFYCKTLFQGIYLGLITFFAVTVFIYTLTPKFYSPEMRGIRGGLFLTLGLSTIIPFIHLLFFTYTIPGFKITPIFYYFYSGGAAYVIGALLYIFRIPERFKPGRHDFFGASHQIFHCFVLLGVSLHYIGSIESYTYRLNYQCPSTVS